MSTSLAIDVIMVENSILNTVEYPPESILPVTVFPNPFDSSISFSIPDSGAFSTSLKIFDNSGRVVYAGEYRNIFPGILTIELPRLVPGIYHYRMQNDSGIFSGSIIKTNTR